MEMEIRELLEKMGFSEMRDVVSWRKFIAEKLENSILDENSATPESAEPVVELRLRMRMISTYSEVIPPVETP